MRGGANPKERKGKLKLNFQFYMHPFKEGGKEKFVKNNTEMNIATQDWVDMYMY